jgi:hypothetical protein
VEEVDLPMIDSEGSTARKTRSGRTIGDTSEADMEEDEEAGSQSQQSEARTQNSLLMTQFSQENNPKVIADKDEAAKVDFSKMRADLQQRLKDLEERKVRKGFEDQRTTSLKGGSKEWHQI